MSLPKYFDLARVVSQHSDIRCAVGAVIVCPKPVSFGFNQMKSHPLYANGHTTYSIHAEMSALLKARCDVSGGTIFVYREDRNGKIRLAKPCPFCMKGLIEAGIKRIYYTTNIAPYWATMTL